MGFFAPSGLGMTEGGDRRDLRIVAELVAVLG
jgi:hypothetical protein